MFSTLYILFEICNFKTQKFNISWSIATFKRLNIKYFIIFKYALNSDPPTATLRLPLYWYEICMKN